MFLTIVLVVLISIIVCLTISLYFCCVKKKMLINEIILLEHLHKDDETLIRDLKTTEYKYNTVVANFAKLKADNIYNDNAFYLKENGLFIILRRDIVYKNHVSVDSDRHSWTICSVNITKNSTTRNEVCIAQVSVYPLSKKIFVYSLDTSEFYEREGHGSHVLEYLKNFAVRHNYFDIQGELPSETRIGIKNLEHFYRKNGFNVKGKVFFWENEEFI